MDTRGKYPRTPNQVANLERCIEAYVLPGSIPPKPMLGPTSKVVTQGSCFAENIAKALNDAGMEARWLPLRELDNTPKFNADTLAHSINNRDEHFRAIQESDLFIVSLGVAEGTLQENFEAGGRVVNYIRYIKPNLPIVITVSPVPLNRTEMPSAVQADCLSKSTLRVVANALTGVGVPDLYYWPSFEMVRWLGAHTGPVFGEDDGLIRHVNKSLVDTIVRLFLKHYAKIS